MTQIKEGVSLREIINRRKESYEMESGRISFTTPGMANRSLADYRRGYGLYHLSDPLGIIEATIDVNGSARVLDIGCGTGHALEDLKKMYGNKVETVGVTAKKFGNYENVDKVFYGDAQSLQRIDGLPSDYFDFAFSVHAVDYMADPLAFLKGAYASLREGGVAYLETFLLEPSLVMKLSSFWYRKGYNITIPWDSALIIIRKKPIHGLKFQ